MFELSLQNISALRPSTRLVAQDILARGYKIYGFDSTPSLLQVELPDSDVTMRLYSVLDERTNYISERTIANNKQVSSALLRRIGIPVPDDLYIVFDNIEATRDKIEVFIKKHRQVVVKPVDGAHGNGVWTGQQSYSDITRAAQSIQSATNFDGFLVQQQVAGIDIRVLCIDGKSAGAMSRLPASVTGDGTNNLAQLIELENHRSERGENYVTGLNKIDLDQVSRYISQKDLLRVPKKGEEVAVVGISNVGAGGIRKNLDDHVPEWLFEMAEQVAKEFHLPICGVDFFVQRLPKKDDTVEDLTPIVLEVNGCPGIAMYDSIEDPRLYKLVGQLVDSHIAAHYQRYPTKTLS